LTLHLLIYLSTYHVRGSTTKFFKIRSILHEHASEFTSTPKREIVCKFCGCLVKSDKRFMVEAHRRSAKHQRGSFQETGVDRHFWNMLYQILQTNYFSFHFNKIHLSVRKQTNRFEPIGLFYTKHTHIQY